MKVWKMTTTKRNAPATAPKMAPKTASEPRYGAAAIVRRKPEALRAWMPAMPAIPRAEMRAIVLDMIG